jgi:hypothetical protein
LEVMIAVLITGVVAMRQVHYQVLARVLGLTGVSTGVDSHLLQGLLMVRACR